MMLILRVAENGENTLGLREKYLDAHRAHLRSGKITVLLSGPCRNFSGEVPGGLVLAEVPDLAVFQEFSEEDPFVKHGIYSSTRFLEWKPSFGSLTGDGGAS